MSYRNHFYGSSAEAFNHLNAALPPAWSLLWEVAVGDGRLDVLAVHPTLGVVVIEAKDWHLHAQPPRYFLEFNEANVDARTAWSVSYRTPSRRAVDLKPMTEPYGQIMRYAQSLHAQLAPGAPRVHGLFLSTGAGRDSSKQFFRPIWEEISARHDMRIFTRGSDDMQAEIVTAARCFTTPVADPERWIESHCALVDELVPGARRVRRGVHPHWARSAA